MSCQPAAVCSLQRLGRQPGLPGQGTWLASVSLETLTDNVREIAINDGAYAKEGNDLRQTPEQIMRRPCRRKTGRRSPGYRLFERTLIFRGQAICHSSNRPDLPGLLILNEVQRERAKQAREYLAQNPTVEHVHFPFDQQVVDPAESPQVKLGDERSLLGQTRPTKVWPASDGQLRRLLVRHGLDRRRLRL